MNEVEKIKKFKENPIAQKIINYYNDGMTYEGISKLEGIELSSKAVSEYVKKGKNMDWLIRMKKYKQLENSEKKRDWKKIQLHKKL